MGYTRKYFCINGGIPVVKKRCFKGCINKKGFTLIELLVVVLIIGILAAIALPQYQKAVFNSRVAKAMARVRAFDQSAADFYLSHGYYANKWDALVLNPGADCYASNTFCQFSVAKGLMFQIIISTGYTTGNYYQWYCMATVGNTLAEDFCSKRGRYYKTAHDYKYYRLKSISPAGTTYYGQTHFM